MDNTCMTTRFVDRYAALQHISDNCSRTDGGRCPMAINLFNKYKAIEQEKERQEREWYEKLQKTKRHNFFVPEHIQKENRQY